MKLKKNRRGLVLVELTILLIFAFSITCFAGSTGKIAGKVIDASTGEPLFGVNVILLGGSGQGAATDFNGDYLILNVAPNTYTLRVSMIGYKTVEISDIRVFIDRTVKIDAKLEEQAYEGEVVIIEATREAVESDRTNTAAYVNEEDIKNLPVTTLSDVIQLQAGVVKDDGGGFHIRGGRSREVAYMIDGISVTNTFSQGGGSNVNVETNFISELQVITGTFNAEYGSAQSGIINVVTKIPDQNITGSVELLGGGYYSPKKPQYIGGLDSYDPFNDSEVRFSFSMPVSILPTSLGKLGFMVNGRVENSNGYLNGERRFNPEDGWEIAVYREWYKAVFDPPSYLVIPLPEELHTGNGETVNMNWKKNINLNTKLVYQPINGLTASYSLFFSSGSSQSFRNTWKFLPDGLPTYYTDKMTHIFVLTHAPSNNIYYNLRYSYQFTENKAHVYEDANDPRYQTSSVGQWDPGLNTGFDFGGLESWDRDLNKQNIQLLNADVTWQINKIVEVKAGFEAKSYDIYYKKAPMRGVFGYETLQFPLTKGEITSLEVPYEVFREMTKNYEYGDIRLRETSGDIAIDDLFFTEYERSPIEAATFAQTTLSLGEIVLNAGVRFDYFYANDRYAPSYSEVLPEIVGHPSYYKDVSAKTQLSPRFGLSFPISDKGALRLSYGHFFQTPSYEKMYENPVLEHYNEFSIAGTTIGNPNLKPEKTIQYEVGLQQELMPGLGMELSVYYKDISDLLGVEILALSNSTSFKRYVNQEYGNSSGITFALDYRSPDGSFFANIDYTYMKANGTSSSPNALLSAQILSGPGQGAYTVAKRRIGLLDWDQTHSLNASMSFSLPWDINLSTIGRLGSALPYTPNSLFNLDLPGGWWDNIDRKPFQWNVDLKLRKNIQLFGLELAFNLNVFNIFNHLEEKKVHYITGRAGPNAYLPELGRARYERISELGDFTFDEADYDPSWYARPRFIQVGVGLQF